ncbi:MAG: hydroxymethylglutaryl-CoA lyase, partial [Bacteroidetes bacterium]|nr:hydroxymethylglutaryl-CoA lyase [Bacteroidota bacterium]
EDELVGNLAMEQFVRHLEQGGHHTGLDLEQLDRSVAEAGRVFPA